MNGQMKMLDFYLGLSYSVTVSPEICTDGSKSYVARITELPGCESHGDTHLQACLHLEEAKKMFIGSMLEDGIDPPPPRAECPTVTWHVLDWKQAEMTASAPTMSSPSTRLRLVDPRPQSAAPAV